MSSYGAASGSKNDMMNDRQRASRYLRSLREWMDQLHWYISVDKASDLPEYDERVRESFPYEWDNIVGRVTRLDMFARDGLLAPEELSEFRALAFELTDLLPDLRRLRLQLPDLDALARAAARPAAAPAPTT